MTQKTKLQTLNEQYEAKKSIVDQERKDIDQKMRQRDILNKDVVTAEEEERKTHGVI